MIVPLILTLSLLDAAPRTVRFSGYEWAVKSSEAPMGPGPNFFSAEPRAVFVDAEGRLHLRIFKSPRGWECAEVGLTRQLGYGTYSFTVDTPPERIDDRAVLGLFTYGDDPEHHHREIDVELSRWGDPSAPNAQFVVQPYQLQTNIKRFEVPAKLRGVRYEFAWRPGSVAFRAVGPNFREEWTFSGPNVPTPKDEAARINFWLLEGKPPAVPKTYEAVVSKFSFKKLEP